MKSCVIYTSTHYKVTSYGNGLSYVVIRRPDGYELFVDGDEAAQFHADVFETGSGTPYDRLIDDLYGSAFQPSTE